MSAPPPTSQFVASRLKIERAKSHIEDMQAALSSFLDGNPYTIFSEVNLDGSEVFKVRVGQCVPPLFGAIVGDVVHNLRSALDLMATDLARANGNTSKTALGETYFPITANRENLEATKHTKIKRLSAEAQDLILKLEPYDGGNASILYALHHLDIADKHASVIPVGAAYVNRSVGASIGSIDGEGASLSEMYPEGFSTYLGVTFQIPEVTFPLEDNAVIATVLEVTDPQSKASVDATFGIVFSDLGIVDGEPVIELLHQFFNAVVKVIWLFETEFMQKTFDV